MPLPFLNINDVPDAIQLALGPAFLLTSTTALLNVTAGRLSRIMDRSRELTENPDLADTPVALLMIELGQLDRRRRLASRAITTITLAALLICLIMTALFLEVYIAVPLLWLVGLLFTGTSLALVIGLTYFLREVHLATRVAHIPLSQRIQAITQARAAASTNNAATDNAETSRAAPK